MFGFMGSGSGFSVQGFRVFGFLSAVGSMVRVQLGCSGLRVPAFVLRV